jgi:hypothetical protein
MAILFQNFKNCLCCACVFACAQACTRVHVSVGLYEARRQPQILQSWSYKLLMLQQFKLPFSQLRIVHQVHVTAEPYFQALNRIYYFGLYKLDIQNISVYISELLPRLCFPMPPIVLYYVSHVQRRLEMGRRTANINTEKADVIDRAIYKGYQRVGGELIIHVSTDNAVSLKRSSRQSKMSKRLTIVLGNSQR